MAITWSNAQPYGGIHPPSSYSGSLFYAKVGYEVVSDNEKCIFTVHGRSSYYEYSGYSLCYLWIHDGDRWHTMVDGEELGPESGVNGDSPDFSVGPIIIYKSKVQKTVTFKCEVDSGASEDAIASISYNIPALRSYTISYNANGGTNTPSNQTKWFGENVVLSYSTPTRKNYKFVGWAISKADADNMIVSYSPGDIYVVDSDLILYAVWKRSGSVRVKIENEWKIAMPYVKVNGVWKPSIAYSKQNGNWKEGT